MTSCKPVNFSRKTLHHEVSKYNLQSAELQLYNTGESSPMVPGSRDVSSDLMLVTVHDPTSPSVTRVSERLLYYDVERKQKKYHITFLGYYISKIRNKCEMLLLETKQAGGKLLHHSDFRGTERRGDGVCGRNITR